MLDFLDIYFSDTFLIFVFDALGLYSYTNSNLYLPLGCFDAKP